MQSHNLSFYNLGIAPKMLNILERLKFVSPMPIQHKAIPIALKGEDVIGVAQTGTGKTLAFGIPVVQKLSGSSGRALILTPTRELALQVNGVLAQLLPPFGLMSAVLIGGAPMFSQIKALRRHPRVLVATPGRLIDHIQQGTVQVKDVNILVLDEADRMFDMGFAPQVEQIIRKISHQRQTMLFSATMPPEIVSLATRHMKLPIHVEIAPSGTTAEKVIQEVFIVKEETKKTVLRVLLAEHRGSILLFTRTKIRARRVKRDVQELGHQVAEIHSDRTMAQRKQAIEGFKSGRYRVLVATDIASRGIDISGIELVINYDLPDELENYVHRIGRTARAGHEGQAITFATPDQGEEVAKIERLIRKTLTVAKHPEFQTHEFTRRTFAFAARGFNRPKRRSFGPRRLRR